MDQITPKHPSATTRVHQALAAGAHQICAEDVAEMLNDAPSITDLLAAIDTLTVAAAKAYTAWNNDQNSKVGKLLMAMAGRLPGYNHEIDAAHKAARAATA